MLNSIVRDIGRIVLTILIAIVPILFTASLYEDWIIELKIIFVGVYVIEIIILFGVIKAYTD